MPDATVHAAAQAAGVICTLADVEGIFSRADASEQEPFVAMGRCGLQIVNPPIEV